MRKQLQIRVVIRYDDKRISHPYAHIVNKGYIRDPNILARSRRPWTRLLKCSASCFLSSTCCLGVLLFGIHTLPPLASALLALTADRSTTRGDEENLMTSRYSILVSVVRERTVGGVEGSSESESESESVEGSRGGVACRLRGRGRGGKVAISRKRS